MLDSIAAWQSAVAPSGALVLASGHYAHDQLSRSEAQHTAALEDERDAIDRRLREHFLRVRTFVQLPPPGYRPDFRDRTPARARAQEYRMIAAARTREAGNGPIGWAAAASIPRPLLPSPLRLHLGSGQVHLDGWLNIDLLPLPGVDLALDVTTDLPFSDVDAVYAEHFLEHLEPEEAVRLLARIHGVLAPGGTLRLSTPNLDYVWATLYVRNAAPAEKVERALSLNRAFYGWQHRCLWNRELLALVLETLGFEDLRWPGYGESEHAHLRGLERHPPYPDEPGRPHVLIV
jgi:SAM-dependent methyltransferase